MASSERDDEFEAYLRRRARIDRRLKSLDRLEPPAELDRIIIGQALQAIQGAAPVTVFRGAGLPALRWALPMGMAATILISLSILLDIGMRGAIQQDSQRALGPLVEVSTGASEERAASAAATASGGARTSAAAAAVAPAPAAAVAAKPSPRTRSLPSKTAPWVPLPLVVSGASEHLIAANRLRTPTETSGSGSAEPMQPSSPAEARMEIVTIIGTRIRQSDSVNAMSAISTTAIPADSTALSAPYVPDNSSIQSEDGLSWAAERHRHPNPQVWLDHIRKMRAAGLTTEADQELRRFHDAYPAFPAPPATPSADGGPQ